MKITRILTTLIFVLAANLSFAEKFGGFGGMNFVGIYHGLGNLNQLLVQNGYTPFNEFSFGYGGGGGGLIRNLYIGGWGIGTFPQYSDNGTNLLTLEYGYGGFNIGYMISVLNSLHLIPIIGIGGGGFNLNISPSVGTNNNFENVIQNPITTYAFGYNMDQSSIGIEVGLKVYLELDFFMLGISAGYIFMPENKWTIEGNNLVRAPEVSQHQVYTALNIHFGQIVSKQKE